MTEYINREMLRDLMYTEAFERDTGLQRWDSGLWIRYKLFENCINAIPAADVVELPCKIGDTVYFLQRCLDSYTFVNYGDVIAFHVYRSYITVEVNDHDAFNPFVTLDVSAFGKTVFLTRAEAEAALKGGQDDVG